MPNDEEHMLYGHKVFVVDKGDKGVMLDAVTDTVPVARMRFELGDEEAIEIGSSLLEAAGYTSSMDEFMLAVLVRYQYELEHHSRSDYMLAMEWVLDGWRQEDDPVRRQMTIIAKATSDALDAIDDTNLTVKES